jgi:hypothetical protein
MMMVLQMHILATALTATLAVAGCGKQQTDAPPNASDGSAAATTEGQRPTLAPGGSLAAMPIGDMTTNAASPSADFLGQSMASPFAAAATALRESYDRALTAFQIGDYARVAHELHDLSDTSNLTVPQKEAVQNLWMQTLNLAPSLAATNKPSLPQLPGR